ncbi:uncharacterized protein DUF3857 [Chitinophaga niastensis]|uniref:Uncharacterized protein DUF3857 n=1 Tax=Chitinophaga niastensis TaxID=536980 RepID=A0A2P8HRX2_CHINA|nr:DUF3857 domain-containing protein [Chitinophaga niastensis]PSL48963.1 uncharacterized protein DUF3857 [Chitinophaga niastensis]
MSVKILFYTVAVLLLHTQVYAQKAKDIREYKERAEAVRQEVWNWDIPAFKKVPALPADDKSSAIVIAKHVDLKASSIKKIKFIGIGFKVKKDLFYSNTVREMVKLNDKVALEEYSQFSFKKFRSLNSYYHSGLATTIVGVRIIKPDGSMKEVKVDEEIVNEEENKEQKSKLAIPDLQVGDVIDYFVRVEELKDLNSDIDAQIFVLGDDKPIMQYSVHCEISDKYFVRYRSANGAPDFKVKKDDDGSVFDMLVKNIPSLPVSLWMSPYRQIPLIRMDILYGSYPAAGQVAGEVRHNPKQAEIKEAILRSLDGEKNAFAMGGGALTSQVKSLLREYKRTNNSDLPNDSLPYYVYYAFRYIAFYRVSADDKIVVGRQRNYVTPNNKKFLFYLEEIMNAMDIPAEFVLVTSRYGPGQDELLNTGDYEYMLKTKGSQPVFMSADGVFTHCTYVSSEYEGQTAPAIELMKSKKRKNDITAFTEEKIGYSTADQNTKIEHIEISLDDAMQQLLVNRHTTLKGSLRADEQKRLLLFEDYYEAERTALAVKSTFMEDFADSRRNRSLAEEYTNAFAKARKDQKDDFMEEINEQFDIKPKELMLYHIDKMGLRHDDPDFVYTTKFTLEGLVKKAGNNYILDAGKLIGGQLRVKPEQRDRKVDIYQPFARSFEYNIELVIPKGYKLEGADKLDKLIDNACGSFTVKTTLEADKLKVHIRKVYKNAFEPVAKWNDLLQVIDAAIDFESQKLLLKKA